ncbi:conserved exported hypothetical protein [Candidatus Desulfarcum epimagneticum]|uniref:Cytochrome c domain-containing protein n=1 Tax=uncultured Desulfobacteraceae bacterium TaxID=218296 RepID=A0A484HF47_9BACT|nr:conserved exported hypothetical protein [uncultured Desulfobacteraceae bacterium]
MTFGANRTRLKNRAVFWVLILSSAALFSTHFFAGRKDAGAAENAGAEAFEYYREHVAPILSSTCSARDENGAFICHGTPDLASETAKKDPGDYHSAPYSQSEYCQTCHRGIKRKFIFGLDPRGEISTDAQFLLSYQQAKKRALHLKIPFAKILRMPLAAQGGGFGQYHAGGEIFESLSSADHQKLSEWVRLENESARESEKSVGEAERFFGEQVLPVYARNGCMSPNCHIFNHSSFFPSPGMDVDDLSTPLADRFSAEQRSFNRMTSKGLIQSNVYLTGDVEQSRILKKNIPIEKGGVIQRGGNNQFFSGPDDPDYQIMKKWLELERKEVISRLRIAGKPVDPSQVGKVRGIVFVRTDVKNHRRYLDVGKYMPGGDLFLLKLKDGETLESARGEPVNLTARFHPGKKADIREPDVRYDAGAVIFSMRIGEQDRLNVYEIRLDENLDYVEGSFRRLTHGPDLVNGIKVHYTDPTYVPDSADKAALIGGHNLDKADIVFASNLNGGVVQSVERGIVGEADGGTRNVIFDFDRPETDGSFEGKRIYIVDGANKGQWRTIARFQNRLFTPEKRSYITVDRPFPNPVDHSVIYVIERDPETQPGFLPSYSMYGMKYPKPGEEKALYDKTISRITYGIAQELDLSVRTTGEVFYSGQRSFTDKYERPIFHMTSCRRHLDTRFSFPTHHGNRSQVLVYADNHELPSGIDIHVGLDPDNLWEAGNLSVSDHQMGPGLEARNPHDFSTGFFDEDGFPIVDGPKIINTRFNFKNGKQPSHTRFVFKKMALFPLRGPRAVSRTGFSPGGAFKDSVPLPDGDILVSHSPAPINHLDPGAAPDFDLYIVRPDPSFHTPGGKGVPKVRKIRLSAASAAGLSDVQAYPVYVRMKPKINAARRARRDHLIRPPEMPDNDHRPAIYLERNYLLIDAIMDDPSPVGKNVAYATNPLTGKKTAPEDEVKYVRMVEVLPVHPDDAAPVASGLIANRDPESTLISNGIHLKKRIVCEVPLEADGSVYIKVPSKTPMSIQSLNKDKMALRQSARLYFFAPGEKFTISPSPSETFQTCGACMGSMSKSPEKLFGPTNMFSGQEKVRAIALAKGEPQEYGIDPDDRISIDFVRNIQPIFDKNCAACHSGENPPAGLSLSGEKTTYYNAAYENLMELEDPQSGWHSRKKYVNERGALAIESYLMEKILGRELKARRDLSGDFPHPGKRLMKKRKVNVPPLTRGEKMTLVRWIDMGAVYRGVRE